MTQIRSILLVKDEIVKFAGGIRYGGGLNYRKKVDLRKKDMLLDT